MFYNTHKTRFTAIFCPQADITEKYSDLFNFDPFQVVSKLRKISDVTEQGLWLKSSRWKALLALAITKTSNITDELKLLDGQSHLIKAKWILNH